jgi:hypothetical protein
MFAMQRDFLSTAATKREPMRSSPRCRPEGPEKPLKKMGFPGFEAKNGELND